MHDDLLRDLREVENVAHFQVRARATPDRLFIYYILLSDILRPQIYLFIG